MNQTQNSQPAPSGVFVSTLSAMHSGKVLADLDDAMREVTKHVQTAQAKGKLTLTLSIVPNGTGAGETPLFKVEDSVKVTLPKKPRVGQTFFADDENNLTRRNPHQDEMQLVSIDGGKANAATPALKSNAVSS